MYTRKQGMLSYFHPNIPLATTTAGVLKEIDIGAASADHGELVCIRPCTVKRFLVAVTGEVAGGTSVAPRVVFTKRPTPLSSSGESVVATVILPDATAVGKVVYKEVEPVQFNVGDSVEISHVIGTGTDRKSVV